MKTADYLGRGADYVKGIGGLKTVAGQGAIDMGIKAAELDKEALEKYNRDLAAQGIGDKTARRAAIRAIYEGTGTWDMDEVDGMLDTYGYRTGGRVGYAIGDVVDTEQITEDLGDMGTGIKDFIGRGIQQNKDALDFIIDKLLNLPGPLKTGKEIIEILVERYGVDPEIAQRKIINKMSDANEGFGPQGPDGTPDDGYNPNIGIDAGAEDYYGETPAMPSGDMMMDENIKMASDPSPMDELNSLSLMLYRKPLDELSEDEYENLKDFAGQTSLKPGLIDEYRNYKMGQEMAIAWLQQMYI